MLVLSRQRDETIMIGDDRTSMVQITPLEEQKLRHCTEPGLFELCGRLLASLGNPIQTTVVDIRGDKVRIGVTAPKETPVHRKEVYEAIQFENRSKLVVDSTDGDVRVKGEAGEILP